ncbi:MAG: YcxB family protein [Candidatus Cybelea sp.]
MATDSKEPMLSFETRVTLTDARESIWFVWRRTKLKAAFIVWLAATAAGAYSGSRVPDGPSFLFLLPITAVAAAICLAGMYWFLIVRIAKKQTERSQSSGPQRWIVDDSGINVENSTGKMQLKWGAINGYTETRSLIFVRAATTWLGIPVDSLSADQKEKLLQLFEHREIRRVA